MCMKPPASKWLQATRLKGKIITRSVLASKVIKAKANAHWL